MQGSEFTVIEIAVEEDSANAVELGIIGLAMVQAANDPDMIERLAKKAKDDYGVTLQHQVVKFDTSSMAFTVREFSYNTETYRPDNLLVIGSKELDDNEINDLANLALIGGIPKYFSLTSIPSDVYEQHCMNRDEAEVMEWQQQNVLMCRLYPGTEQTLDQRFHHPDSHTTIYRLFDTNTDDIHL